MERIEVEIKGWDFSDLTPDRVEPDDPNDFLELLIVLVGRKGYNEGEWFDFVVCTPKRLSRVIRERHGKAVHGRFTLVVETWDLDVILAAVHRIVDAAPQEDWPTFTGYLAKFGMWEYEVDRQDPLR